MASKKCSQCAEAVKVEALVCRFCGHKFPEPAPKRPMSGSNKLLLVFGGLVVVAVIGHNPGTNNSASNIAANATPSATPSSSASNDLGGMAVLAGASLKKSARDPDSLEIERAFGRTEKHGVSYVCITYRARNGFGGMNREHVVFSLAGGDPSSRAWNKWCTGSGDYDELTGNVKTGTSMSPT